MLIFDDKLSFDKNSMKESHRKARAFDKIPHKDLKLYSVCISRTQTRSRGRKCEVKIFSVRDNAMKSMDV